MSGEVGVDAGEVDGGAGELVLEACLGQAPVAGSAQAAPLESLGDGALDTRADLVALFPLIGLLLLPCGVESVVRVTVPQAQFAPRGDIGVGALPPHGARLAIIPGEQHADHRQAVL